MRTVAIAGLGAVGMACARALDAGVEGLRLSALSAGDLARARARVREAGLAPVPEVVAAERLGDRADIVVECAPAHVFRTIVEPALARGREVLVLSAGALLEHWDLVALAAERGGRIHVPSGALLGLDAVQAARRGTLHRVRMVTTKPPAGLDGAPYLAQAGIDVHRFERPTRVFAGSAREGAAGFPANVNVAAALGLAGLGPDRTELEIWVDPTGTRNRHEIVVDSDSARMRLEIENVPSEANPRTGRLVAQSVVATLAKLASPLAVGT